MSVIVIAEAGVNHNGSVEIAKELIDVAALSGADYVKFQSFKAESLVQPNAPKAPYQYSGAKDKQSQFEMLSKLELSHESHKELIAYSKLKKIEFISTAFDLESLEMLASLGQTLFKIPSGEINNIPYLRSIAKYATEIILSTGMSTMEEIGVALNVIQKSGVALDRITVLHCTSAYPTPFDQVNLLAMQTIGKHFGVKVGYSDHTLGTEVSLASVSLGACIIEKHFTLSRTMEGPDHKASLEPSELIQMISGIRHIESALGDGVKVPQEQELLNRDIARRSIVSKVLIQKGEIITEEKLTFMRPGTGISVAKWDKIVGTVAKQDFNAGEMIQ
jgi:N,N'-diacetyllegionaminate synthase